MTQTRLLIWILAASGVLWVAITSLPPPEQDLSRAFLGELLLPLEQNEEYTFEFTLPYKASVSLSIAPVRQLFWPNLDEIRNQCEQKAALRLKAPNFISLAGSEAENRAIYFDRDNNLTDIGQLSQDLQIRALSESCLSRHRYGYPVIKISDSTGKPVSAYLYEEFGALAREKIHLETFDTHQTLTFTITQNGANSTTMAPRSSYRHYLHLHRLE